MSREFKMFLTIKFETDLNQHLMQKIKSKTVNSF